MKKTILLLSACLLFLASCSTKPKEIAVEPFEAHPDWVADSSNTFFD